MRLHVPLAFALLFAVTGLAAADDKEQADKEDRKKLLETWQFVSLEIDGTKSSGEDAKLLAKMTAVKISDSLWFIELEGHVVLSGTGETDPTKKPKAVDLTVPEGNGKGQTYLGIYESKDDTCKVCLGKKERPTEFSSTAGGGYILVVLKRVKK